MDLNPWPWHLSDRVTRRDLWVGQTGWIGRFTQVQRFDVGREHGSFSDLLLRARDGDFLVEYIVVRFSNGRERAFEPFVIVENRQVLVDLGSVPQAIEWIVVEGRRACSWDDGARLENRALR